MLTRRIIPCLDVANARVVKGIQFLQLRDIGDPVECAKTYAAQGADELVFLDITATHENRGIMRDLVARTAAAISIPLTVGGGLRTLEDIDRILAAGAAKVSLGTAALQNPQLIAAAAARHGSHRIIIAIDAKRNPDGKTWQVHTHGGRTPTPHDAVSWARQAAALGAGELLPTSMDADGMQTGYDTALTRAIAGAVTIPVIASGGAGTLEHIAEVLTEGRASAALAASLFHYGTLTIPQVKAYLSSRNIPVRKL
jgi:cyclase